MTLLIAAIIATATNPVISVQLESPTRVESATLTYTDLTGAQFDIALLPYVLAGDMPADATAPGVFDTVITNGTETVAVEVYCGGIWGLFGNVRKLWEPKIHVPEPIPVTYKVTVWPTKAIVSHNWIPGAMANYIYNQEKKSLHLLDVWYNSDIKKYGFRWEVTE